MRIEDSVILITGASSGIGEATARRAAALRRQDGARRTQRRNGITVSTVFPPIVAAAFHEHLRQGALSARGAGMTPVSPDKVAGAILDLIETGGPERVIRPA